MRTVLSLKQRSITSSIISWGISDEFGCAIRAIAEVDALAEMGVGGKRRVSDVEILRRAPWRLFLDSDRRRICAR